VGKGKEMTVGGKKKELLSFLELLMTTKRGGGDLPKKGGRKGPRVLLFSRMRGGREGVRETGPSLSSTDRR